MLMTGLLCRHCNDISDLITPYNGKTLLANTSSGETIVALHTRCEEDWANRHNCYSLVPLKKMRHRSNISISSGSLHH
jgi:hypothetical protein